MKSIILLFSLLSANSVFAAGLSQKVGNYILEKTTAKINEAQANANAITDDELVVAAACPWIDSCATSIQEVSTSIELLKFVLNYSTRHYKEDKETMKESLSYLEQTLTTLQPTTPTFGVPKLVVPVPDVFGTIAPAIADPNDDGAITYYSN